MNLAQALRKKNVLKNQIFKLEQRIVSSESFYEGKENYDQAEYDGMCVDLNGLFNKYHCLRIAIDEANHTHASVDSASVYDLILEKEKVGMLISFRRRILGTLKPSDRGSWWGAKKEDEPELFHRENVKDLEIRIDGLDAELLEIEDQISVLNGKIQVNWSE